MGFLNGSLVKSPKIRSVVHTSSRYFHVLISDIKHTSYTPLVIFFFFFFTVTFLKNEKTVANKMLNGTTGAVGDIKHHHAEQFINVQYFPTVV